MAEPYTLTAAPARQGSVDVFRALTMFFMVFVNDLWTLDAVPKGLGHTLAQEDGMGFSDIIFPLFLFIVGLSIPLALRARKRKGDSPMKMGRHIVFRSFALLVMGFYYVNYGSITPGTMIMDRALWLILVTLGFFLVWMRYGRIPWMQVPMAHSLQFAGILLLLFLAATYRGGTLGGGVHWMRPWWWGILGLIGWAYLFNGLAYLILKGNRALLLGVFALLMFMNVQENGFFENLPAFKLVVSASNHVLVMAGMLCSSFFLDYGRTPKRNLLVITLLLLGVGLIAYGLWLRPHFIISKIMATPSWTAICMGSGVLIFLLLHGIVDRLGLQAWAKPIRAAGTSTLTCYLIPFFIYPLMELSAFHWPDFLAHGAIGLGRCLLFSYLVVALVALLEKRGIGIGV